MHITIIVDICDGYRESDAMNIQLIHLSAFWSMHAIVSGNKKKQFTGCHNHGEYGMDDTYHVFITLAMICGYILSLEIKSSFSRSDCMLCSPYILFY